MRAVRCHELTGPSSLRVDEVPEPSVGAGEVRITVRAAGVNFPDVLLTRGLYQLKPALPLTPGTEVSGVVDVVGDGVTTLAPGDRVAAISIGGCFAEKIVVPADFVVRLPDAVSFEVGAGTLVNYGTTLHALVDRAAITDGEWLLVLGAAGGVGIAAVEIGALLGARVIAAASTDDKLAFCTARGASAGINYTTEDIKKRARGITGSGVDVVYDPVGGALAEPAIRALAWHGRYLVIGFAAGDIPRVPLNLPLLAESSIVGVYWGAFVMRDAARLRAQAERLFGWIADGKLAPHVDGAFSFEQAADVLGRIERREVRGKMVLVP